MEEHHIVERKGPDNRVLLTVYYRDNEMGIYHARPVGRYSVVLSHGAVSFPVGTFLKVQFHQCPDQQELEEQELQKNVMAIVRHNSASGMLLGLQSSI